MKPRSPTLEGFRAILRQPSLGLAEIAWRWSCGGAAAALATFALLEYLDTLTVSRRDLLLLKARQPALVSQAISHIFRGSAGRVAATAMILALALSVGWSIVGALARAATIEALLDYFRDAPAERPSTEWKLVSLLGLNFFRVAVTLAAVAGCFVAFILGGAASPADDPSPGVAFPITLAVILLVWMAWTVLNWVLSLAPIFVVRDRRDVFASIAASIDFCRDHAGSVFAAGTWFGLGHIAVFFAASTAVAFPLGLAGLLPLGVTLGGVLIVIFLYFAIADFLYMGRLAAYVAMLELTGVAESPSALPAGRDRPSGLSNVSRSPVDPDELILSDLLAPS